LLKGAPSVSKDALFTAMLAAIAGRTIRQEKAATETARKTKFMGSPFEQF
jgi:hypothetical protein